MLHCLRERRLGVLLVRLGGHAAGVFEGRRLVSSKVGSRQVHGRSAAGCRTRRPWRASWSAASGQPSTRSSPTAGSLRCARWSRGVCWTSRTPGSRSFGGRGSSPDGSTSGSWTPAENGGPAGCARLGDGRPLLVALSTPVLWPGTPVPQAREVSSAYATRRGPPARPPSRSRGGAPTVPSRVGRACRRSHRPRAGPHPARRCRWRPAAPAAPPRRRRAAGQRA